MIMPAITIFETPQIVVWYHPDTKIIHHQMRRYTHGKDFRDALMLATHWLHGSDVFVTLDRKLTRRAAERLSDLGLVIRTPSDALLAFEEGRLPRGTEPRWHVPPKSGPFVPT